MIGRIVSRFLQIDLALLKLEDSEVFTNSGFENADFPSGLRYQRLRRTTSLTLFTTVYLDSAFTDSIAGMFLAPAFRKIPSDDADAQGMRWIKTVWLYNSTEGGWDILSGTCGSHIFTADGDVVGTFWSQGTRPGWS